MHHFSHLYKTEVGRYEIPPAARLADALLAWRFATYSTVTDLARLRGLWLRPALRALTWLRQVSLRRKPHHLTRLRRAGRCAAREVGHSPVTDFAKLRGLSTSVPRAQAVWYANNCSGTTCRMGDSAP